MPLPWVDPPPFTPTGLAGLTGLSGMVGGSSPLFAATQFFLEFEDSGDLGNDSLAGNRDFTPQAAPTQVAGKVGNAVQLVAASSQYLLRASEAALQTGNRKYGGCAWVKLDTAADRGIFWKDNEFRVFRSSADNTIKFQHLSGTGSATTVATLAAGATMFVLFWFDPAGTLSVKANADATNTVVGTAPTAGAGEFRLGNAGGLLWDGWIDQALWFVGYNPTAADAAFLYNNNNGRSAAELAAYSVAHIRLWDLLNRNWWLKGKRPPERAVKEWLPRIPRALRGRKGLRLAYA